MNTSLSSLVSAACRGCLGISASPGSAINTCCRRLLCVRSMEEIPGDRRGQQERWGGVGGGNQPAAAATPPNDLQQPLVCVFLPKLSERGSIRVACRPCVCERGLCLQRAACWLASAREEQITYGCPVFPPQMRAGLCWAHLIDVRPVTRPGLVPASHR